MIFIIHRNKLVTKFVLIAKLLIQADSKADSDKVILFFKEEKGLIIIRFLLEQVNF